MQKPQRESNATFLARLELERLSILHPTSEQLEEMQAMLKDEGTIMMSLKPQRKLSRIELACLYQIIRGKSATQIAAAMHLKRQTIRNYFARIHMKLGTGSLPQAVFEAMRRGYILPKTLGEEK